MGWMWAAELFVKVARAVVKAIAEENGGDVTELQTAAARVLDPKDPVQTLVEALGGDVPEIRPPE